MDIIELTRENIAEEHIGCALGGTPDARLCAQAKKAWMEERFSEGYRFWRLNARGKALIETMPAEHAWAPIKADGWTYIGCFWVSGAHKGQGVANRLLQQAVQHAKQTGSKGLVAVSSDKKRPFLSDPGYLRHKGFVCADTAPPYFELLALPFAPDTPLPAFRENAKKIPPMNQGVTVWYSNQCPHTAKYLPLLQQATEKMGVKFTANKLENTKDAQNAPSPFTPWAMYFNGRFETNEIFSPEKMEKYLETESKK